MNNIEPNPISEYYIAYFDILAYKGFFEKTPKNEQQFLKAIHEVIYKVKGMLKTINGSELVDSVAKLEIKIKIFSDNFLLCTNVGTDVKKEKIRLLAFIYVVSEIQRNFVVRYGLFVRGGIIKGTLSFNDDYVFGKGLIKAVEIEESTKHPRIAIHNKICEYLNNIQMYSKGESERAMSIQNKIDIGETISDADKSFYNEMMKYSHLEYLSSVIWSNVMFRCADDVICISYLYCIDLRLFLPNELAKQLPSILQQIAPNDKQIPLSFPDVDRILGTHQTIVESKLMEHNNYLSFNTTDIKDFDLQESILRKYIWAMYYHNKMCVLYNKPQYHINTIANCENRHMKLTVFVVDENGNIKTNLAQNESEQPTA